MKKAAVLGCPIDHSLSPKLHGYWLNKYNIAGEYKAIETQPAELKDKLSKLADSGYIGVNLTVPLKEKILPIIDDISDTAKKIGAVNTVIFSEGKLLGDNTDAYGFIENLRQNVTDISQYLDHCVILGAGGAAKAIIVALVDAGAKKITILNRTYSNAEAIADIYSIANVETWGDRNNIISSASLLVNTTSLGMKSQPKLDILLNDLPVNALVTDIVYNPLQTNLLKQAKAKGNKTVDGLGMLINQAVPAFEKFFKHKPEVDINIRNAINSEEI